jgi:hypothetical protein
MPVAVTTPCDLLVARDVQYIVPLWRSSAYIGLFPLSVTASGSYSFFDVFRLIFQCFFTYFPMLFHLFSDTFSLILRRFYTHFLLKDHPSAAEQVNKNS